MFHVVKRVPLQTDVFGLLADQGILGVRDGALIVLLDGGCSGVGALKISHMSKRRWSLSLVASAAE
jgi:hypothetical protein